MLLITHNSPTLVDCETGRSCLCRCPRNKRKQHVLLVPLDPLWFWRLNGLPDQDETMIPTHIDDLHAHHSLFAVGMTTVSTEMETVHVGATYWPQVVQVWTGRSSPSVGGFLFFFPVVHSTVCRNPTPNVPLVRLKRQLPRAELSRRPQL